MISLFDLNRCPNTAFKFQWCRVRWMCFLISFAYFKIKIIIPLCPRAFFCCRVCISHTYQKVNT